MTFNNWQSLLFYLVNFLPLSHWGRYLLDIWRPFLQTIQNHHGGYSPDALHHSGLCHLCPAVGGLSWYRPLLCILWWASEDNTGGVKDVQYFCSFFSFWCHGLKFVLCGCSGVSDGRQIHELPARVLVPTRHIPVCCGHPGCSFWGVHLWDSVLVLRLLILSGPAHPGSCVHTSVLQTATLQCVWGKHDLTFFKS